MCAKMLLNLLTFQTQIVLFQVFASAPQVIPALGREGKDSEEKEIIAEIRMFAQINVFRACFVSKARRRGRERGGGKGEGEP